MTEEYNVKEKDLGDLIEKMIEIAIQNPEVTKIDKMTELNIRSPEVIKGKHIIDNYVLYKQCKDEIKIREKYLRKGVSVLFPEGFYLK